MIKEADRALRLLYVM